MAVNYVNLFGQQAPQAPQMPMMPVPRVPLQAPMTPAAGAVQGLSSAAQSIIAALAGNRSERANSAVIDALMKSQKGWQAPDDIYQGQMRSPDQIAADPQVQAMLGQPQQVTADPQQMAGMAQGQPGVPQSAPIQPVQVQPLQGGSGQDSLIPSPNDMREDPQGAMSRFNRGVFEGRDIGSPGMNPLAQRESGGAIMDALAGGSSAMSGPPPRARTSMLSVPSQAPQRGDMVAARGETAPGTTGVPAALESLRYTAEQSPELASYLQQPMQNMMLAQIQQEQDAAAKADERAYKEEWRDAGWERDDRIRAEDRQSEMAMLERRQAMAKELARYKAGLSKADQSALEQRISLMAATGVPIDIATGIATGRYARDRDPVSGRLQVVDMSTGEIIYNGQQGQAADAAQPAQPVQEPTSSLPGDIDYSEATGTSGVGATVANTVADAFGAPELPAPQAERAAQALTNLKVRTQSLLQSAVPGRPSNYLMGLLEQLSVKPNSLLMGDTRAKERLQQTRDMLKEEVERIERDILGQSGAFQPGQIAETRANVSGLKSLLRDYDQVLNNFGTGSGPPSQSGQMGRNRPGTSNRDAADAIVFGSGN